MNAKRLGTWVLPGTLTLISTAWAVAAIGDILTAQAAPAFAYSVAVLYDAVWLYALAQETAHRRQGSNARLPKVIGWVFLPLTVAILAGHGLLAGDVLAAAVGALVPVLAKMTLVMAVERGATQISPRAQTAIDRGRAATRDRIALSQAVADSRAAETKAAAEILRRSRKAEAEALTTAHEAQEKYAETRDRHAVTDWHTELPGLISDRELEALLAGGVTDDETAGGTGGFAAIGHGPGTRDGHGALEGPRETNNRAVALLAAEIYAADPPPSKRKFRELMRERMNAAGLTGGWDTIDALYDREQSLGEVVDGGETA